MYRRFGTSRYGGHVRRVACEHAPHGVAYGWQAWHGLATTGGTTEAETDALAALLHALDPDEHGWPMTAGHLAEPTPGSGTLRSSA